MVGETAQGDRVEADADQRVADFKIKPTATGFWVEPPRHIVRKEGIVGEFSHFVAGRCDVAVRRVKRLIVKPEFGVDLRRCAKSAVIPAVVGGGGVGHDGSEGVID